MEHFISENIYLMKRSGSAKHCFATSRGWSRLALPAVKRQPYAQNTIEQLRSAIAPVLVTRSATSAYGAGEIHHAPICRKGLHQIAKAAEGKSVQ